MCSLENDADFLIQNLLKCHTSNSWSLLNSVVEKLNRKGLFKTKIEEKMISDMIKNISDDVLNTKGIWFDRKNHIICINSVYGRARENELKNYNQISNECSCNNQIKRKDNYFSSHDYNGGRHACSASTHKASCSLWKPPESGHLHSWRRKFDGNKFKEKENNQKRVKR